MLRFMDTAWIAGATGLVGSKLLPLLLDAPHITTVVSLGRRPSGLTDPKLVERSVDFARLDTAGLPTPTVALCCLGSTIKKAGSKEAFRAIDHDAVLSFAKAAQAAGATRFVVVTAEGADAGSMMFYNRVKGEAEASLRALGFTSLAIARPSLLMGERAESRPGERAAVAVSRFLAPVLRAFEGRPIEDRVVAAALVALTRDPPKGAEVFHSGRLQELGGG